MIKRSISFCVAAIMIAATANATTVNLHVVYPDGPSGTAWQMFATTSTGDNAGLYNIGFDMGNITSLNFDGPTVTFKKGGSFTTYGWSLQLTPSSLDTSNIPAGSVNTFGSSQGLADPPLDYAYGIGQTAGSTSAFPPPQASGWTNQGNATWNAPVLLFDGTRPAGTAPTLAQLGGAVFAASGSGAGANVLAVPGTSMTATIDPVPEPASFVLMGLAGVGLIVARRRTK